MTTFLLIIAILFLAAALLLSFADATWAAVAAFIALCFTGLLPDVALGATMFIFWGVAVAIVVALRFMLPETVRKSRLGLPYISGGALAGMLVGLALSSHAAIVAGAFVGAVLGGVAYARTPAGKVLEFPTSKFLNYLCAKGLPAVVTMSIAGTVAAVLAAMYQAA